MNARIKGIYLFFILDSWHVKSIIIDRITMDVTPIWQNISKKRSSSLPLFSSTQRRMENVFFQSSDLPSDIHKIDFFSPYLKASIEPCTRKLSYMSNTFLSSRFTEQSFSNRRQQHFINFFYRPSYRNFSHSMMQNRFLSIKWLEIGKQI